MTERDDLDAALEAARRIGERLRDSLADLAGSMPLTPEQVQDMDRHLALVTDAFLKRFESLVSQLQDQVWPRIAVLEGEDPAPLSRRDVMELMEKLYVLDSANAFRGVAMLRNRLSHAYTFNPERIARRLNEVHAAAPVALRTLETTASWVARRLGRPASS